MEKTRKREREGLGKYVKDKRQKNDRERRLVQGFMAGYILRTGLQPRIGIYSRKLQSVSRCMCGVYVRVSPLLFRLAIDAPEESGWCGAMQTSPG